LRGDGIDRARVLHDPCRALDAVYRAARVAFASRCPVERGENVSAGVGEQTEDGRKLIARRFHQRQAIFLGPAEGFFVRKNHALGKLRQPEAGEELPPRAPLARVRERLVIDVKSGLLFFDENAG